MELVASSPEGGSGLGREFANSDLAFWGDLAVSGNYEGFRLIDVSNPAAPRVLSQVVCSTRQGDVSVWETLIFLSVDTPQTARSCESLDTVAEDEGAFEGIRIFDIGDPADPRFVGAVPTDCGSHTNTLVPDEDNGRVLLYVSSYAHSEESIGPRCRNPHAHISVVEVPLNHPEEARVVAEPPLAQTPVHRWPTPPNAPPLGLIDTTGCHDVQIFVELRTAAVACMSEGQLWDIADPLRPRVIHHIDDPEVEFWHSAAFTWDGEIVVFGDESFFGEPGCQDHSVGNLLFFRVSDPSEPLGRLAVPRMQGEERPCTYHNFNVVPSPDRYLLATAAYTAGTSIVEFTDPTEPREIAYYDAADPAPSETWSSYWYNGYVFATDLGPRGLDIFRVDELEGEATAAFPRMNPQTQEALLP
jgi:hypothetical protein